MAISRLLLVAAGITAAFNAGAAMCEFTHWIKYQNTSLLKHASTSAYIFQSVKVKVDADGAPNAYHPDDVGLHCVTGNGFKGLDCPANAGYPNHSWWNSVLVPDQSDPTRAYVQKASSTFAGYFVSQTTLQDRTKETTDPAKFVDSRTVPYLVFPRKFHELAGTGTIGDLGYAVNLQSEKSSPFIVADVGPADAELGEMSIALAVALGGSNPNPRTGAGIPVGKTIYVIFPRSRFTPAWPVSNEKVSAQADKLFNAVGGKAALGNCIFVQ
jgi:hypothetical protein